MRARCTLVCEGMKSPGTDVAEVWGVLVLRATRARLYEMLTARLHASLDEATYPVLSGLARVGPVSSAELADRIGLDRSVVSRHAARLCRAKLVARKPDPEDRRAVLLLLTAPGRRVVRAMRQRLARILDDHFDTWPPGEARRFAANFRKLVEEGPFGTTPAVVTVRQGARAQRNPR